MSGCGCGCKGAPGGCGGGLAGQPSWSGGAVRLGGTGSGALKGWLVGAAGVLALFLVARAIRS